jgi:hypothetical protein
VAKEFAKCDENDGFLPKRTSSSKFILNGREALLDFESTQKQNCILLDAEWLAFMSSGGLTGQKELAGECPRAS